MMKEEMVEADVLCVGGGIAGLMASIRAAELGARLSLPRRQTLCVAVPELLAMTISCVIFRRFMARTLNARPNGVSSSLKKRA
jgi:NADPH-dependent 2,4-dienoyl-CoA reductase/sulfur reductase-like enzyme